MRTVLVIDDEECVREVVHALLESEFRVLEAANGPDGLRLALQEKPEVILLDFILPGMDGPATLAKLRQDPTTCDIPVVLMSGLGDMLAEDTAQLKTATFMQKPFRRTELIAHLRRAITRPVQAENVTQRALVG